LLRFIRALPWRSAYVATGDCRPGCCSRRRCGMPGQVDDPGPAARNFCRSTRSGLGRRSFGRDGRRKARGRLHRRPRRGAMQDRRRENLAAEPDASLHRKSRENLPAWPSKRCLTAPRGNYKVQDRAGAITAWQNGPLVHVARFGQLTTCWWGGINALFAPLQNGGLSWYGLAARPSPSCPSPAS